MLCDLFLLLHIFLFPTHMCTVRNEAEHYAYVKTCIQH